VHRTVTPTLQAFGFSGQVIADQFGKQLADDIGKWTFRGKQKLDFCCAIAGREAIATMLPPGAFAPT
jgi:hypothetical protein